MKLSFSDIANSEAYQVQATAASKANMTVATVTAILIMLFANWGFGYWWVLIIPCLWFISSFLIALPFMLLRVAAVAVLSENFSAARLASGLIDLTNYVVLVLVTYFGLRYLHSLFFG